MVAVGFEISGEDRAAGFPDPIPMVSVLVRARKQAAGDRGPGATVCAATENPRFARSTFSFVGAAPRFHDPTAFGNQHE